MLDSIIKNGKVVTHTDVLEADVAIENGIIAAIGYNLGQAKEVIDAKGNYVMPGCIDPHNHIGMFVDYNGDLKSETGAGLIGGNTMMMQCGVGNYPIMDVVKMMKDPIKSYAYGDVGMYAALLTDDDLTKIPELSAMGINSYKFFLAYKGKFAESIGLMNCNIDNGYLYEGIKEIKKVGGLPMFHAENVEMVVRVEPEFRHTNTLKTWADARPNIAEEIDFFTACEIAEFLKSPVYQVHSSVARVTDIAREFRLRGNKVYMEGMPQYCILDYEGKNLKEPLLGKINPPIRSHKDRDGCLENLKRGEYDVLATDSANSMYADKKKDGNIWNMILDWSSAGLMLPLVLSEFVNKGHLTMPDVVRMSSYNTAKIHGYAPKKGMMAPGSDADIIIVDLNKTKKLSAKTTPSWSDWCLYEGWELKGWPVLTMLRGKVVVKDDKLLVEPGFGEFVKSQPAYK